MARNGPFFKGKTDTLGNVDTTLYQTKGELICQLLIN